jgi:hypothetical protein
MPRAAPVMAATFPLNSFIARSSLSACSSAAHVQLCYGADIRRTQGALGERCPVKFIVT